MQNSSSTKTTYAFIDSQNLNLGTSKNLVKDGEIYYRGWELDFRRFYIYLNDKFRVKEAFLFLGYIKKYEKLYSYLRSCGYKIIFKPTVKDNLGKPKGNIDAEMVLHSAKILYNKYDEAVFVSRDGDFYCLYEFMQEHNKLKAIIIPNKHTGSSLLNRFTEYKYFIHRDRKKLEKINGRRHSLSRR